jgi:hypothetical protein
MPKPKNKTYQLTQVCYVIMNIKALSPQGAEKKLRDIVNNFDTDPNNEPEYQSALAQSNYEIESIEEIEETYIIKDDRKPDRKGKLD